MSGGDEAALVVTSSNATDRCHPFVDDPLDALTVLVVACNLFISLFATVGNLLVIVSVARFSVLRTPTNHFVAALALADLLVGLNIPFYISFYFDVPYVCEPAACKLKTFVAIWTTLCSFLLLIGVAFDRYVSIVHPLTYPNLVSRRVSRSLVLSVCVYVTGFVALPHLWPGAVKDLSAMSECDLVYVSQPSYAVLFCAHIALSLVATTLLYGFIFHEAWLQNRHHMHSETKTALMMVLIFGVNIISTLPYLVVVGIRYLQDDQIEQRVLSRAKQLVMILYFGKSAINPLIYGWKNRDFRHAFTRLLHYVPCKWLGGGGGRRNSAYAGGGSRQGSRNASRAGSIPSTLPVGTYLTRDLKTELPPGFEQRHCSINTSSFVLPARGATGSITSSATIAKICSSPAEHSIPQEVTHV